MPEELLRQRGARVPRASEGRAALGLAGEEAPRQERVRGRGAAFLTEDAEHEQLDARGGHVGAQTTRRADRGEEVGRGRLAIASRDGLGVLAGVVARVERRAAAQEELAYCETSKNGSFVERGLPSFVALIDSRARVEQEDRCGALVL